MTSNVKAERPADVVNKYPDLFKPTAPHPYYHLHPIFKDGSLFDKNGEGRNWADLKGKSVALFFGNHGHCKTNNFYPHLLQLYKVFNENNDGQKVEVVYVPLETDRELYAKQKKRQPWLCLDIDDPLVDDFKQHFRVFNAPEIPKYAYGPRSEPPTLLIIKSDGTLLQDLDVNKDGPQGLQRWDWRGTKF
eukprot:Selendium_serpulae@DN4644_c0_g1_i1.p2